MAEILTFVLFVLFLFARNLKCHLKRRLWMGIFPTQKIFISAKRFIKNKFQAAKLNLALINSRKPKTNKNVLQRLINTVCFGNVIKQMEWYSAKMAFRGFTPQANQLVILWSAQGSKKEHFSSSLVSGKQLFSMVHKFHFCRCFPLQKSICLKI